MKAATRVQLKENSIVDLNITIITTDVFNTLYLKHGNSFLSSHDRILWTLYVCVHIDQVSLSKRVKLDNGNKKHEKKSDFAFVFFWVSLLKEPRISGQKYFAKWFTILMLLDIEKRQLFAKHFFFLFSYADCIS